MSDRLRVAVISPVWFPVPPTGYGGIEWVVSILAEGLGARGHDVTLFASGGSTTCAELVTTYAEPWPGWDEVNAELPNLKSFVLPSGTAAAARPD